MQMFFMSSDALVVRFGNGDAQRLQEIRGPSGRRIASVRSRSDFRLLQVDDDGHVIVLSVHVSFVGVKRSFRRKSFRPLGGAAVAIQFKFS